MLIITIILMIVAFFGVAMATSKDESNPNIKGAIIATTLVFAIMATFASISTVGVGEVGIKTRFGAVVGKPLSPGIQTKIPFVEKISIMDTKIKKLEVDANAASKDLQTITSKLAVNYSVKLNSADSLFKEVGPDYQNIIIAPAIQESVKSITAQYTAEELISKRSEVSKKMQEALEAKIKDRGLTVNSFNITNFDFSPAFNAAIEAKQVAQQNVLKAQQELEQTKVEAEKKVAQAEADAKAKIANAQAEAESLKLQKQEITDSLLRLREIEVQAEIAKKWNGQLPTYMTGENGVSLFNITK
jgi:regulator of protease activity HflC (stomatin/prohibitin superfamily)